MNRPRIKGRQGDRSRPSPKANIMPFTFAPNKMAINKMQAAEQQLVELKTCLNSMRDCRVLTDITLVCCGSEFPAHKAILAGSSSYFYAMFTSSMKESVDHMVELKGIEPAILDLLLQFMYTGHLNVDENDLEKILALLAGADYLQIRTVLRFCWDTLLELASIDNFILVWDAIDKYSKAGFEEHILTIVARNFPELVKMTSFLSLSKTRLISILRHPKLCSPSPDFVLQSIMIWVKDDMENRLHKNCMKDLLSAGNLLAASIKFLNRLLRNEPLVSESSYLKDEIYKILGLKCSSNSRDIIPRNQLVLTIDTCAPNRPLFIAEVHLISSYSLIMPTTICREATCITINGNMLYAFGGFNSTIEGASKVGTKTAKEYNLLTRSFKTKSCMNVSRYGASSAVLSGSIYVIGGMGIEPIGPSTPAKPLSFNFPSKDGKLTSVERYDISTDSWHGVASLSHARYNAVVTSVNGRLYVLGQNDPMECYDPTADHWFEIKMSNHMPKESYEYKPKCATEANGNVYVLLEKASDTMVDRFMLFWYDPITNEWFHDKLPSNQAKTENEIVKDITDMRVIFESPDEWYILLATCRAMVFKYSKSIIFSNSFVQILSPTVCISQPSHQLNNASVIRFL